MDRSPVVAAPSVNNSSSGWVVSRAVLYFGVAAVVVVWASAFSCLMCHCMRRRRRRNQTAAAEAAADAQAAGMPGAPRYFPTTLPVVIVNPDNVSLELGVKEERPYAQQASPEQGTKTAGVDAKPAAASPGALGAAVHSSDSASSLFPLSPLPPPGPRPPPPPYEWPRGQRGQRGQQPAVQQFVIQMGQAGVWMPADGDDPAAASSGGSLPTTSPGTGGAWGYRGTG